MHIHFRRTVVVTRLFGLGVDYVVGLESEKNRHTKSQKEMKEVKLGKGCAGILMDQDGLRAFVACSSDHYIAIVDLKTLEVTRHATNRACIDERHFYRFRRTYSITTA